MEVEVVEESVGEGIETMLLSKVDVAVPKTVLPVTARVEIESEIPAADNQSDCDNAMVYPPYVVQLEEYSEYTPRTALFAHSLPVQIAICFNNVALVHTH